MPFEMFKLIDQPDYVPYCGPCSGPIVRVVRDPSGMFNTCPRCKNTIYLNCLRKSRGDMFWDADHRAIAPPKYWLLNDGKDRWFSHAGSTLGEALLHLNGVRKHFSIIILPELKARG